MWHTSSLQALSSGWWIMPNYDSWHANMHHQAVYLDRTQQPCAEAEYFTTCSVLQIFLSLSLQGLLLLNLRLTLQSSRCQKKRKEKIKVRQGWLFLSVLFFFFLSARLEHFVLPYWEGCRVPNRFSMVWCQLCSSVINCLDHGGPRWTVLLLCYADKLNHQLLAPIHKPQTKKIRNSLKIISPYIVNPGCFLNYLKSIN